MRRLVALGLLVGGPLLFLSRRRERPERVQLHFDDGSTVVLDRSTPEAAGMIELARSVL